MWPEYPELLSEVEGGGDVHEDSLPPLLHLLAELTHKDWAHHGPHTANQQLNYLARNKIHMGSIIEKY